jgi:membrane-associated HD superfamily phosphohydrolase
MTVKYAEAPPEQPRTRAWVKVGLAICCAIVASMWIYYFFFATDKGVYQMQDKTWRVAASKICKAASTEREALTDTSEGYITNPTHAQMLQRADIVDKATDILEQMLDDIVAIPVDNSDDVARLQTFDENYRIVISDRRRYTARLRKFELTPYDETLVAGGPVSNVVLDFTAGVKGNAVPECSPPGELGGDVQP